MSDGDAARKPPSAAERDWRIHPHGAIRALESNLWTVSGEIPGLPIALRRTMTVVQLTDGRLVLHSVIALAPTAIAQLEAWGEPAFVVVPGHYHRLDALAYKQRYPNAKVVCPLRARAHVEKRVAVDGDYDLLPRDPALEAAHLEGSHEGVLIAKSGPEHTRATLVLNDLFFNQAPLPGIAGWIYGLFGSTGGPKINPVARRLLVDDRQALRAHLESLARREDLVRIIPGHGEPVDVWPGKVLARAAAVL